MKYIIASDIHGSSYWCERLCEIIDQEMPDRILLLGDILYHGPRNDLPRQYNPKAVITLLSRYADKILAVRGNCDSEVDQMVLPFPIMADYTLACDEFVCLYMTHGHHANPENLPVLPTGCCFLYGHTHVKMDKMVGAIRCLNPGSVSIPKDGTHSLLIYQNGDFTFRLLEEKNG